MKKEFEGSNYITWTYSDYGWHPTGYKTLKEAVNHESYGGKRIITRGEVDWEALENFKCPYPDCPKVKYKECSSHGS